MVIKVIIWDNDGTILGSLNPNDQSNAAKVMLPNVEKIMNNKVINIICSGCATPESEMQNFDAEKIIDKFTKMMQTLPIAAATFSPAIGGIECYVLIKDNHNNKITVKKAHEDERYKQYIGKFKKPNIGMFAVISDVIKETLKLDVQNDEMVMIGDTWHDEVAAKDFGISFLDAKEIHNMTSKAKDIGLIFDRYEL